MSPSVPTRENREFASELKFIVAPETADQIRNWAQCYLHPDPHAGGRTGDQYRITSLYFDTRNFDVYNRNGSYGRSKLRIRRYGESEIVFLERKLKARGLVTKRRSVVPLEWLGQLGGGNGSWPGAWFERRLQLRRLNPVCQISYQRTARVAQTQWGPIRLTIDEDLRALEINAAAFSAEPGMLLSRDFSIIEMKFLFAMPAAFKHVVEEFSLTPRPFSKYRFAAHSLGFAPVEEQEQSALNQPTAVYA